MVRENVPDASFAVQHHGLPLPCANSTMPGGESGSASSPSSSTRPAVIRTSLWAPLATAALLAAQRRPSSGGNVVQRLWLGRPAEANRRPAAVGRFNLQSRMPAA